MSSTDKVFAGAIPRLYEQYLGPLLFEPYAADLARRVAALAPGRVLEVACGFGVMFFPGKPRALLGATNPAGKLQGHIVTVTRGAGA